MSIGLCKTILTSKCLWTDHFGILKLSSPLSMVKKEPAACGKVTIAFVMVFLLCAWVWLWVLLMIGPFLSKAVTSPCSSKYCWNLWFRSTSLCWFGKTSSFEETKTSSLPKSVNSPDKWMPSAATNWTFQILSFWVSSSELLSMTLSLPL